MKRIIFAGEIYTFDAGGTPMAEEIKTLCAFRDKYSAKKCCGQESGQVLLQA
ncbi:MAG: hypothetical protein KAV87_37575 [Desulfobacteraceae bacterium]|nr:hypothetical protein [Desulfobacteraceae bacterium]